MIVRISDPEKFVYLWYSLKEGTAKHAFEGLSCSSEHYAEAIECLTAQYDCFIKPMFVRY